jgi:leucyl/phenylalanyl-tRNA--protein transferase
MIELYTLLYKQGYAHSIETYKDNELVGGLYGVSIGKVFFGESMFSKVSDASKIAFAFLVDKLKEMDFHFIDAQVKTDHLLSLGAKEISREHFLNILNTAIDEEPKNNWK